jgi:hypothetical protein
MCSAASFFPKPTHGSWRHPRSKQLHQLDHLLISRNDLCRVRDAGVWNKLTVESDHAPLQMKLRIARNLSKQTEAKGKFINRELLRNPTVANSFRLKVLDHLGHNGCQPCAASYSSLREAVTVAAKETLTNAERRRPGWFNENQLALTSAINSRNNAQRDYNSKCKPGEQKPQPEYEALQQSRKQLKLTVSAAKNSWMDGKIKGLGQGNKNPKAYWDCVNNIKAGFNGHSKKVSEQRFRNKNGDICSNPVENAKTVKDHFQNVYNIKSDLDPTVFDQVKQRPIQFDLDAPPSVDELRKALISAKKDKATGDSKVPVEFLQILSDDESTENLFHEVVVKVWESGECDNDWLSNRLKLLPKKGDLKLLDNWRGIMLIEAPVKVISSILAKRISVYILESEGLEEQNGFMRHRGCCDGIFAVKMALQKRHEHGLGTWAVFIDLVKAFDSVPRDGLSAVLDKFGIPPKMRRLIMKFHSDLVVKVLVGEDDVCFESSTGVKQGCPMAPILFALYFQAANEVVDSLAPASSIWFKSKNDFIFTGRKTLAEADSEFQFDKSLYADDKTKLYESREKLTAGMQIIFTVFKRFGLTCHVGRNGGKSKTEAMFFPPPGVKYEDADLSPIAVHDGEITFTKTFKLLGSMLAYDLKDNEAIECRIKSAQGAFSAIRKQFFSAKGIKNSHKKTAYEGLILSILLYGCETWSLTKQQQRRLQLFHNSCVRAMCRVTMWHVREYKISQANLEHRLLLEPFDYYLARRRLRWAGHVSRMPMSRLPRLLLSSWVDHKRPKQRPQFTYGHGLKRDLSNAGVDVKDWGSLAMNRNLWHAITQQKNVHCNYNGGGYAWMDESVSEDAAAERILPLPSSYAGVILGLSSASAPDPQSPRDAIVPPANSNHNLLNIQPTVTQVLSPPANSSLTIISSPITSHVPQRCSRRLAAKAEQAGGRLVYSHTNAPRVIRDNLHPTLPCFQLRPVVSGEY